MTATVETTPLEVPDAGVIDDARARQRKHRWWLFAAAGVAVAVAATLLLAGGGGGTPARQSRTGDAARTITFASKHFSAGGMPIGVTLDPAGATASFSFNGSYTVDNNVPTTGPRVLVRWDNPPADPNAPGRIMVAIVGPGVASVRAANVGTFTAHHVTGLPTGYGAVVFYYPKWPVQASLRPRTVQNRERYIRALEQLPRLVSLTPLNASGRATAPTATKN